MRCATRWSRRITDELPTPAPDTASAELPQFAGQDAEKRNPNLRPANTYNDAELDVLALAYTGVKVLYAGALSALPSLIRLIEPVREVKDLHLTRVRNENAYYCCIAQLVSSMPASLPPLPPSTSRATRTLSRRRGARSATRARSTCLCLAS